MNIFIQQLINALVLGSLIGFIALGYSMVYGVLKLINFAHGPLVTLATYLFMSIGLHYGLVHPLSIIITLIITLISITLVTILLELIAYRPLQKAHRLSLLVSALGAGMVIQNVIMLIWGPNPQVFPSIPGFEGIFDIHGIIITKLNIIILGLTISVMGGLYVFINKSRIGIAIRAVSQDYQTAQLMGVNINYIIILVFIIGALLGAIGGIFIGLTYKTITFNMGFEYGLKAFIATIIGGIGSIPGAMLGGILIGIIQTFSAGYVSSTWANVITYGILIILLIYQPRGLLGIAKVEKV